MIRVLAIAALLAAGGAIASEPSLAQSSQAEPSQAESIRDEPIEPSLFIEREPSPSCPREAPAARDLELTCTVHNSTELTLTARAPEYVTLQCAGGSFSCNELPRLPASFAPSSTAELRGCPLPPGPLACSLRALAAPSVSALTLRAVPAGAAADLRAEHVAGLNLTSLTLVGSGSAVATPPTAALATLHTLRHLTIRDARLKLLPNALNVPHLEYLELSLCELRDLPAGAIRGAELRTLSLWGNEIEALPAGALSELPALEALDLSSNPLAELAPGALGGAPRLRVLHLVDVALPELKAESFAGLDRLEELVVIDGRENLSVGAGALALPALRVVQIERCKLNSLPGDAFGGGVALKMLSLAHNALTSLPDALLERATSLRSLNVSYNALTSLSPALFAPLSALTDLNLDHNNIEEFQDNLFANLRSLRSLTARNNQLRVIAPSAISASQALTELALEHNRLAWGAGDEGDGAVLDAEWGAQSPLRALRGLVTLALANNSLAAVMYDWRALLTDLRYLDLSHNNLTLITEADVSFVSAEVVVDLRHNNISTVLAPPAPPLPGDSATTRVLLDGNPFDCDCHLHALLRRLADPHASPRLELGAASCAAPPALAGRAVSAVPRAALLCALPAPLCPEPCSCALRPEPDALELTCTAPPRAVPDPDDFGLTRAVLALTRAPAALPDLPVHELLLVGLNLTEVPPGAPPKELEVLDLTDNRLTVIPPPGPALRLAGNPLACSCAAASALAALQGNHSRVLDYERLTCAGGERVWRLDAARLCTGAWVAAGAVLAALGALAAAAAALYARYPRQIRVWLWSRGCRWGWLRAREPDGAGRVYDAFVSFAHEDRAEVSRLVAGLQARGYALCVHYRDFTPGEAIGAQIARAVAASRRTLVVLSAAWLRSQWARSEFRAAHEAALREGRARVVLLVLGAPPAGELGADLRAYLDTNTYLAWDDPWFWSKLQYALPRPASAPVKRGRGVPAPDTLAAALSALEEGGKSPTDALVPRLTPKV